MLGSAVRMARLPGAAGAGQAGRRGARRGGARAEAVVTAVRTQACPGWWRGVASPGFGGYVLAFLVSAAVMGVGVPLQAAIGGVGQGSLDARRPGLRDGGRRHHHDLCPRLRPSRCRGRLPAGAPGLPPDPRAVHPRGHGRPGRGRGRRGYDAVLFDGFWGKLWILLAIATSSGRAAVIPLARRRQA